MVTGFYLYDNKHFASQVEGAHKYFSQLIEREKFDTIIELGTQMGGLTYMIDDAIKGALLDTKLYTLDFKYFDYVESQLNERGVKYLILDETLEGTQSLIINLITNGGKTLLLCDGGFKIQEFNIYSNYLKEGDFIMAHDYSQSLEYFNNNINEKIWNWCEITDKDIQFSIDNNNLKKYSKINFQEIVWGCFYK